MKLYLASMNLDVLLKYNQLFSKRRLNVLRSFGLLDSQDYPYVKEHREKFSSLILDSGTWTLNNAKRPPSRLTLPNYIRYVSSYGGNHNFYFNFDSDFHNDGFGTNLVNQLEMEKAGLTPVPVVHDIHGGEINYYIYKGYKRVALGSKQIKTVKTLETVMKRFQGTGIKIHLFGNSRFDFLSNFPIDSCDTAGWAHTGKYGFIWYPNPKKGGVSKPDMIYLEEYIRDNEKKKIMFSKYEFRQDLEKYLKVTFGVTYSDLIGPKGAHSKMLVNTHYYALLEDLLNRIHREKGFKTG